MPFTTNGVTIDCSKNVAATRVDAEADECLKWKLTAKGGLPTFVFVSETDTLLTSADFGGPTGSFTWKIVGPKKPAHPPDTVAATKSPQRYGLRFSFIGSPTGTVAYTLKVDKCDRDGNSLEVLKDCSYTADDPMSAYQESLKVTWQKEKR
jgi:rRNA maturation protein Nop10